MPHGIVSNKHFSLKKASKLNSEESVLLRILPLYRSEVFKLINNHAVSPNSVIITRAWRASCVLYNARKSHSTLSQLQDASHCFSAPAHTYSSFLLEVLNTIIVFKIQKVKKPFLKYFYFPEYLAALCISTIGDFTALRGQNRDGSNYTFARHLQEQSDVESDS